MSETEILTTAEIAERYDIPVGVVRSRVKTLVSYNAIQPLPRQHGELIRIPADQAHIIRDYLADIYKPERPRQYRATSDDCPHFCRRVRNCVVKPRTKVCGDCLELDRLIDERRYTEAEELDESIRLAVIRENQEKAA